MFVPAIIPIDQAIQINRNLRVLVRYTALFYGMHSLPAFIYFDLDDTLIDHKASQQAALADTHAHFHELFDGVGLERLQQVYHHHNVMLWEQYGRHEIDRPQLQRARFQNTLRDLGLDHKRFHEVGLFYMQAYRTHWVWMPDAQEVYEKIKSVFPVGILTNGFAETQHEKLRFFGLEEANTQIVISEEVGYMKPQPEVFAFATQKAGVAPHRVLYVGDSYTSDVQGGKGFGWQVAWYDPNGMYYAKREEADVYFCAFKELLEYLRL